MKRNSLLLLYIAIYTATFAQAELTRSCVASSGGDFTNGSVTLSTTVAELTMVTTFDVGSTQVYQGFQNSARMIDWVYVSPNTNTDLTLTLYPNPANTSLMMEFTDPQRFLIRISLVNPLGQIVHSSLMNPFQNKVCIDVSTLSAGMYTLTLEDKSAERMFSRLVNVSH